MRRVLVKLLALVILFAGLALAAAGAATGAVVGPDGAYVSQTGTVSSREAAVALIADIGGMEIPLPRGDELGESVLIVTAPAGKEVFLGRGQRDAVDEYLFGLPYDVIQRDGGQWTKASVPGVTEKAPDPVAAGAWVDQDVGPTAELQLRRTSARTFAILNADGSPAVTADISLAFRSTYLFPVAAGAVVVGALLAILGVYGLLRWGRRRA